MFQAIIVLLLTLTIILFPIPLKTTLKYSNKFLEIYIYNKKIKVKTPSKVSVKGEAKTSWKRSFFRSFTFNDIKLIIHKISNLKFKPTIILNTKLEYGFDDAALVAILYGIIHSAYSFLYLLLVKFSKVKKIDLKVTPHFKENDFNIEISSIIYTNLGKIIYISFIMIYCLISIKHKNANLKKYRGGNLHG